MLKRHAGQPLGGKTAKESLKDKVELLTRLDKGASVKLLCDDCRVGSGTVYDLKKQKEKVLKFYVDSELPKLMEHRKTLYQTKNIEIDTVFMEWI
jgi:hypothetical protein